MNLPSTSSIDVGISIQATPSTGMGAIPVRTYVNDIVLFYMTYYQYAITSICQVVASTVLLYFLVTAIAWPHLLRTTGKKGLARTMFVYLVTHFVSNVVCIPFNTSTWYLYPPRGVQAVFNIDWRFWLGIWTATYMTVQPIAAFYLALDRFLILVLNVKYTPLKQDAVFYLQVGTLMLVFCGDTFFFLTELPLGYATSNDREWEW